MSVFMVVLVNTKSLFYISGAVDVRSLISNTCLMNKHMDKHNTEGLRGAWHTVPAS